MSEPLGKDGIAGAGSAERTTLAWQRTTAAAALVALWAAFTSLRLGEPTVGIASTVIALGALLLGVTTPRVSRHHPEHRPTWLLIERASLVLGLTALLGVLLVIAEVVSS